MSHIPKCLCQWRFLVLGHRRCDSHDDGEEGPIEEGVVEFVDLKIDVVESSCSSRPYILRYRIQWSDLDRCESGSIE